MFSLILSILIINNKVNDNVITNDFYNFAVFCLVYDIFIMLYNFALMYKNGFHRHPTSSFFIYLIALVEAALIIESGPGNKVSDQSFRLAIIFIVIESLSIAIKFNKQFDKQFDKEFKQFDKQFKQYENIGKITKNRKMTARYI